MNKFSTIEKIIKVARKGNIFILVDDESRENEGDLVFIANKSSPEKINFMAKHGRGLICLAMDKSQINKLGLKLMPNSNNSRLSTAFTVSIEARRGVTTGISAKDRSKTILTAIKKTANKKSIVTPGHIFPLVAKDGGVLTRAGHTEASVDIAKLAKIGTSAVICEIMNDDGSMAKGKDLFRYAKKYNLKISTIADLIAYRLKKENFVFLKDSKIFEYKKKYLKLSVFENKLDQNNHWVFHSNNSFSKKIPKVRVITTKYLNIFKGKNLIPDISESLDLLYKSSNFILVIIRQSDFNDLPSSFNIPQKLNSSKTNLIRNYGVGAQILKKFKIQKMILVTRSKKKIVGFDGFGIKITKQEIFK